MSLLGFLHHEHDENQYTRLEEALERLLLAEAQSETTASSRNDDIQVDPDASSNLLEAFRRHQIQEKSSSQSDWLRAHLPDREAFTRALACLTSAASDAAIQERLLDIFGVEHIDDVGEAIARRAKITAEAHRLDRSLATALSTEAAPTPSIERLEHAKLMAEQQMQDRLQTALLQAREKAMQDARSNGERSNGHIPSAQIQFLSLSDKKRAKEEKKAAQKRKKTRLDEGEDIGYTAEELERIRIEDLEAAANRPLFDPNATRIEDAPRYPHVYALSSGSSTLAFHGQKFSLPLGTTRKEENEYYEVTIPCPKALPMGEDEELIRVDKLDVVARGSFAEYKTLNRLQSLVYRVAYQSNENMLVCAPTGAGKTDVAMLTVLRALLQHSDDTELRPILSATDFKIIYVAPMKALAAEIVRKMSKRLHWLGVSVRELTGDMQLTRSEIAATHLIVTTPEKWDVVTRRPEGDTDLAGKVRLLIIDEVHLLHDDRGSVIESIVARTLRQVESSQRMIRIIGLSATLPNYVDVADFLRVNRFSGMFYFDSSFRPVPLEQHFLGVKGKTGSPEMRTRSDSAVYDKVRDLVKEGRQVMVFVHSRKDTVKTAEMLRMRCNEEQELIDLLDPKQHARYDLFRQELRASRNREMKELFDTGFGIHHAGMLRSDRSLSERMFEQNVTKILVCTATLAWGVNLPAYAVIIKGTQVFDSTKGSFVDLSILDVLQIFGRAGRPQYESQGVGYICTSYDKMDHYVSAITQQHPIESKFEGGLLDALNAEIALGTVTSVDAGSRWLGYTYLYVRMRKNPIAYGIDRELLLDDPQLGVKRHQQIMTAVKHLVAARMIIFDRDTASLSSTDLGKIASKYYLRYASIEVFNKSFTSNITESKALDVLSRSVEFDQLKVRESEVDELKEIEDRIPCSVASSTTTTAGKVNVLLQAYISRLALHDFALISDMGYVSQNAGRIARALLDIAISRRWSTATMVMSSLCKATESRRWPFHNPLQQMDLPAEILYSATQNLSDYDLADIKDVPVEELAVLLRSNARAATLVQQAARRLPRFIPEINVRPLTCDLLQVSVCLEPDFEWIPKLHGKSESFWAWISDEKDRDILQLSHFYIYPEMSAYRHDFVIHISILPTHLYLQIVSERWFGDEVTLEIDLKDMEMPSIPPSATILHDVPLFRMNQVSSVVHNSTPEAWSPTLDPILTECFHSIMHTRANLLLCMSSPSNQQNTLDLVIWRALQTPMSSQVVAVVGPHRLALRRLTMELRMRFDTTQAAVRQCNTPEDCHAISGRRVLVFHSDLLLKMPSNTLRSLDPAAIILTQLHLLDPSYELSIARLRRVHPDARVVGISQPLIDSRDLAHFLGVPDRHLYAFSPSSRADDFQLLFQSFSTRHSIALFRSMVPPAYEAISAAQGSSLLVVPTRGQCRLTANELSTLMGSEFDADATTDAVQEGLATHVVNLVDQTGAEALNQGVGIWHKGVPSSDQQLILQLYAARLLRVLIVPREEIYNIPATVAAVPNLTIVMGAQSVVSSPQATIRGLRDYTLGDIAQCANLANSTGPRKCIVMCQGQQAELYERHFRNGIPLESLLTQKDGTEILLRDCALEHIAAGNANSRQDLVDWLSWTFLARRLRTNPHYYDCDLSGLTDATCSTLRAIGLVRLVNSHSIQLTALGRRIAAQRLSTSVFEPLLALGPLEAQQMIKKRGLEIHVELSVLRSWQSRLPKSARDILDETTPAAEVLMAGWFAARTPVDEDLEIAQARVMQAAILMTPRNEY